MPKNMPIAGVRAAGIGGNAAMRPGGAGKGRRGEGGAPEKGRRAEKLPGRKLPGKESRDYFAGTVQGFCRAYLAAARMTCFISPVTSISPRT